MKTFSAALLAAAVCLLAANGVVEASRVGPARQLQQFNNGLGEFCSRRIYIELEYQHQIKHPAAELDGLGLMLEYRQMSYVRRGMCLLLPLVHFTCHWVAALRWLIMS